MTKRKYLQKLNGKIVNKSTKPHIPSGNGRASKEAMTPTTLHASSSPQGPVGALIPPPLDLSKLDANQQTLFKIAWQQYIALPTPQWFNVLMGFLKDTHQLKTETTDEWQQVKQLTNDELTALIKPGKYSLPATPAPRSSSSLTPSN